jgi:fluoride exporter
VTYLYIVAGAAVGAPLRYFLGSRVQERTAGAFPWGTLVVNVSGCLLIGFILAVAESRGSLGREARLLLVTGFLGSYTTFSAFGWETYSLARADDLAKAALNVAASVVVGLAAVWAGAQLGRLA